MQTLNVYAKTITEKPEKGRIEIDWGSEKVRFSGQAERQSPDESSSKVEKRAWDEGLLAAREEVIKLHRDRLIASGVDTAAAELSAKEAGDRFAMNTYSKETQYSSDGHIKVQLEASLAIALQRKDIVFQQQKAPKLEGNFSGLVLRCDRKISPRPTYRVVDETGRVLFDVSSVAKEAFEKNLMGRWLEEPSRGELTSALGAKPVSISVKVENNGDMVAQGFAWNEAMRDSQSILANAKIVVALPGGNVAKAPKQSASPVKS